MQKIKSLLWKKGGKKEKKKKKNWSPHLLIKSESVVLILYPQTNYLTYYILGDILEVGND